MFASHSSFRIWPFKTRPHECIGYQLRVTLPLGNIGNVFGDVFGCDDGDGGGRVLLASRWLWPGKLLLKYLAVLGTGPYNEKLSGSARCVVVEKSRNSGFCVLQCLGW